MRILRGGSSWLYFLLLSSWRKVSTFMGKQLIHLHFEQWNYPFLFRFRSREGKMEIMGWTEKNSQQISPLEFLLNVRTSIRQSTVSHDFLWNWADTIFFFQCCLWNYGVKKAMNIHFAHFHKLRFMMLQIAWQNLRNRASSGKSNPVIECLSAFWVREND